MENRCLVYEDHNGKCGIIIPHICFQQPNESEEAAIGRLYFRSIPEISEFIVAPLSCIPNDQLFQPAWRKGDKETPITIDIEHCKVIHRQNLKIAAMKKIAALETDYIIAVEKSNLPAQVAINRTKQILRTIHQMDLSHCKTPDDVKYSIPAELFDCWDLYDPRRPQ